MTDFSWTDKVDNIDDVVAEDINSVANEVVRLGTAKQDNLESGTNIKTINGNSLLGSGNVTVGDYSKPQAGIPKTDLADDVQASLDLADTAIQEHQDISGKQDVLTIITQSSPSAITLADNTEYFLTGVSDLALTYPNSEHWECVIVLTTASSGDVTISFPQGTAYIGDVPNFSNSETWEISIRDGVVVTGKAVSV